jgi:hypothetical protein
MKAKIRLLGVLLVCLSISFIVMGGLALGADSKGRPEISDAERAVATIQVQNTFSKHCYYHEAGMHKAEMLDIWVKKDGQFAKTAKWQQPMGINEGYDAIWQFYAINKENSLKQNLADISKVDPSIKNVPENLGAGGEWASHTQSTPIIEVAGDGKTAKGIWESPGLHMTASVKDGKITKQGGWFWEKYAADFVKEDGKWKIWHIAMYYENTPPSWDADTNSYQMSSGEGRGGQAPAGDKGRSGSPAGDKGAAEVGKVAAELAPQTQVNQQYNKANPNPYKAWSPTKVPKIDPKFPEPYYTFSETFSY